MQVGYPKHRNATHRNILGCASKKTDMASQEDTRFRYLPAAINVLVRAHCRELALQNHRSLRVMRSEDASHPSIRGKEVPSLPDKKPTGKSGETISGKFHRPINRQA